MSQKRLTLKSMYKPVSRINHSAGCTWVKKGHLLLDIA